MISSNPFFVDITKPLDCCITSRTLVTSYLKNLISTARTSTLRRGDKCTGRHNFPKERIYSWRECRGFCYIQSGYAKSLRKSFPMREHLINVSSMLTSRNFPLWNASPFKSSRFPFYLALHNATNIFWSKSIFTKILHYTGGSESKLKWEPLKKIC